MRSELDCHVDALFDRPAGEGITLALVILRHGELVAERYGVRPPSLFGPAEQPITAETAVVVHLGKTDSAVRDRLVARLRRIIAAL